MKNLLVATSATVVLLVAASCSDGQENAGADDQFWRALAAPSAERAYSSFRSVDEVVDSGAPTDQGADPIAIVRGVPVSVADGYSFQAEDVAFDRFTLKAITFRVDEVLSGDLPVLRKDNTILIQTTGDPPQPIGDPVLLALVWGPEMGNSVPEEFLRETKPQYPEADASYVLAGNQFVWVESGDTVENPLLEAEEGEDYEQTDPVAREVSGMSLAELEQHIEARSRK